jgi:hypothetical protein
MLARQVSLEERCFTPRDNFLWMNHGVKCATELLREKLIQAAPVFAQNSERSRKSNSLLKKPWLWLI